MISVTDLRSLSHSNPGPALKNLWRKAGSLLKRVENESQLARGLADSNFFLPIPAGYKLKVFVGRETFSRNKYSTVRPR